MTEDADRTSRTDGPVDRVKAVLVKAGQAVASIVKKDDTPGAGASGATANGQPTENANKMKAAVEAARKAQDDD